jgi:AraC-like DNA-binding protein
MDNIVKMKISPPFQVRTSGIINHDKYHSTPGTRAKDFMLMAFTSGRGIYRRGSVRISITPGTIGLIPPDPPYGVLISDKSKPYSHAYCRFNGSTACELARDIIQAHGGVFFSSKDTYEIAGIIRSMGYMIRGTLPDKMGQREVKLMHILLLLTGDYQQDDLHVLSDETIRNYLEAHINTITNLDAMAEYFRTSKSTLCRAAQKLCGTTIQQLHQEIKMEWAKELLCSGEFNVRESAARTGYKDPLYFSRVFRKTFGKKPSEFLNT